MTIVNGIQQRRPSVGIVRGIDVRTAILDEIPYNFEVAIERGEHERCLSVCVRGIHVRVAVDHTLHQIEVAHFSVSKTTSRHLCHEPSLFVNGGLLRGSSLG